MPVYKFRTFEEAREVLLADVIVEAYLERVADLWATSARLYPRRFPPGVYKYRSIEKANRADAPDQLAPHHVRPRLILSQMQHPHVLHQFFQEGEQAVLGELGELLMHARVHRFAKFR